MSAILDKNNILPELVRVIKTKVGYSHDDVVFLKAERPLNFYNRKDFDSRFLVSDLFKSCNEQNVPEEPIFKNVEDLIDELNFTLDGDSFDIVKSELSKDSSVIIF